LDRRKSLPRSSRFSSVFFMGKIVASGEGKRTLGTARQS
jgi:hypothetical protein